MAGTTFERKIINGPYTPLWYRYPKAIEAIIKKYRLNPATQAELAHDIGSEIPNAMELRVNPKTVPSIRPQSFPGGLLIPHIHYKGNIYLLNEKQWKEFSSGIMKGFQEKLAKANSVNFSQLSEISDVVDTLA